MPNRSHPPRATHAGSWERPSEQPTAHLLVVSMVFEPALSLRAMHAATPMAAEPQSKPAPASSPRSWGRVAGCVVRVRLRLVVAAALEVSRVHRVAYGELGARRVGGRADRWARVSWPGERDVVLLAHRPWSRNGAIDDVARDGVVDALREEQRGVAPAVRGEQGGVGRPIRHGDRCLGWRSAPTTAPRSPAARSAPAWPSYGITHRRGGYRDPERQALASSPGAPSSNSAALVRGVRNARRNPREGRRRRRRLPSVCHLTGESRRCQCHPAPRQESPACRMRKPKHGEGRGSASGCRAGARARRGRETRLLPGSVWGNRPVAPQSRAGSCRAHA